VLLKTNPSDLERVGSEDGGRTPVRTPGGDMTAMTDQAPPNVHDMRIVHRVFRRESRTLAEAVTAAGPRDIPRARVLAAHFRAYALVLHHHHSAEDDLLWPKLLARVDLEADLVLHMEAQHEQLAAGLERIGDLLSDWEQTAAAQVRDEIALALVGHRAALLDHLDEEETHVLPLLEKHITVAEWEEIRNAFTTFPSDGRAPYLLGALLEEATADERTHLIGELPLSARLGWRFIGRHRYGRRMRLIRGQGRP
jgi:hemerythrin-like domain-containing protein